MSAEVINIYIPSGSKPPRVQSDFTTASGGDAVIWKVFNANKKVRQVEIAFEEDVDYFGSTDKNVLRKAVPPGTCAIVHGIAPIKPGLSKKLKSNVRSDKYDIRGLDSKGKRVKGVLLDPEIIVKVP